MVKGMTQVMHWYLKKKTYASVEDAQAEDKKLIQKVIYNHQIKTQCGISSPILQKPTQSHAHNTLPASPLTLFS